MKKNQIRKRKRTIREERSGISFVKKEEPRSTIREAIVQKITEFYEIIS